MESFKNKLPKIKELLLKENMLDAILENELSDINKILGENKRYDLIKEIKKIIKNE